MRLTSKINKLMILALLSLGGLTACGGGASRSLRGSHCAERTQQWTKRLNCADDGALQRKSSPLQIVQNTAVQHLS